MGRHPDGMPEGMTTNTPRRARKTADSRLHGEVASEGLVAGPLFRLSALGGPARKAASPVQERRRLRQAIKKARRELEGLVAASPAGEAARYLEIQLGILGDGTLTEPAEKLIGEGTPAPAAWAATVAFGSTPGPYANAYTAARDSDTRDVRDRVARILAGERAETPPLGAILLADEIGPSQFLDIDWSHGGGLALFGGSRTSHIAMLARARGVPMLTGLRRGDPADGAHALLDCENGELIVEPSAAQRTAFSKRIVELHERTGRDARHLPEPAYTSDGTRIQVAINIAQETDLADVDPAHCDGIGLVRTEFLFQGRRGLPNEKRQFEAYERIVEWAGGRPVTFRALDGGGDKPIPGLSPENEDNPFLGLRGIRLLLRHPAVFRMQLRALLRAAALGPVRIMLPMVSAPEELAAARAILEKARHDLKIRKVACGKPPLGIMVEVPAAALAIEEFDADFYSIGSNDLIQYTTGVARTAGDLAPLARADGPAVMRLIETVIAHGYAKGREVSLCGDMGGDPRFIPALLARGLKFLSVSPLALARTKAAIARYEAPAL